MNIYFSCSITGGRNEEKTYQVIVEALQKMGHEVPTAILSSPRIIELEMTEKPVDVFERDMAWLRQCDAVVAEVSSPSHGVGYEIAYALSLGKPVLCCYHRNKRISKIITGNTSPRLTTGVYDTDAGAVDLVREFIVHLSALGA